MITPINYYTPLTEWEFFTVREDNGFYKETGNRHLIAEIEEREGKFSLSILEEKHSWKKGVALRVDSKKVLRSYSPGTLKRAIALLKSEITCHQADQPRFLEI